MSEMTCPLCGKPTWFRYRDVSARTMRAVRLALIVEVREPTGYYPDAVEFRLHGETLWYKVWQHDRDRLLELLGAK